MAALLKLTGLSWRELIRAIWRGSVETNVTNRAAELAFWFLLGFFAMLLSVTGMVSMIGWAPGSQGTLMTYVGEVLPSGASGTRRDRCLRRRRAAEEPGFHSSSRFWSSSSATSGLIDTLNAIYQLKRERPLVEVPPDRGGAGHGHGCAADGSVDHFGLRSTRPGQDRAGSATLFVWKIAQWPAAALLLIIALLGLYRFAPNLQQQRWKWLLPGSMVAAVTWMAVSVLFKLYVRHFSHFGLLYGSLGTLIILMFWFYLSGAAILVGGVINAILEDAAAEHSVPGAIRHSQRLPSTTRLRASAPH